jgi:mandelate racemase
MAVVLKVTNVRSRAVVVPLRRPVIADIGRFEQWPLILVDIETTGGIVGSSYIAPYRAAAVPSVIAEIRDIAQILRNAPVAPTDFFDSAEKRLNVIGVSGVSLIAISAIDMALWDARAKAAELPLAVFLGGTLGPVRAYNSNGLWRGRIFSDEASPRQCPSQR